MHIVNTELSLEPTSNLAPDFTWRLRLLGWCLSLEHGECYPKIHPIPSTGIFRTISREIPGISERRGILPSTIVQDYWHYSRDDLDETQNLFIELTSKVWHPNDSLLRIHRAPKICLKSISIFWIFLQGEYQPNPAKLVISCYQGHAFRIHFQLLKPWMVGAWSSTRWWLTNNGRRNLAPGFSFPGPLFKNKWKRMSQPGNVFVCINGSDHLLCYDLLEIHGIFSIRMK